MTQDVQTTHGAALLRLTVTGPVGTLDAAVPAGTTVAEVAAAYRERLAPPPGRRAAPRPPFALTTPTGALLDDHVSLEALRMRDGDVLVAVDVAAPPTDDARETSVQPAGTRADDASPDRSLAGLAVPLGAATLAAVAAVAATTAHGSSRDTTVLGCGVLLVVLAVVAALLADVVRPAARAATTVASPALAAAGAACLALGASPSASGRLDLLVGCAALGAAAAAAVVRTSAPSPERAAADTAARVVLVGGALTDLVCLGSLLLAAPDAAPWAVLLLVGVVVSRVAPSWAVDVPDDLLIDLRRLAATAWSARERPRRGRRGIVRRDDVVEVARRAHDLVVAASAVASLGVVGTSTLLLATVHSTSQRIGADVMVLAAAAVLLLGARSLRSRAVRATQRLGGYATAGTGAGALLHVASSEARGVAAAAALVVALGVLLAAVATGRGWRSTWWGRAAELADTLTAVAAVAAVVPAAGLFDAVRQLTGG